MFLQLSRDWRKILHINFSLQAKNLIEEISKNLNSFYRYIFLFNCWESYAGQKFIGHKKITTFLQFSIDLVYNFEILVNSIDQFYLFIE